MPILLRLITQRNREKYWFHFVFVRFRFFARKREREGEHFFVGHLFVLYNSFSSFLCMGLLVSFAPCVCRPHSIYLAFHCSPLCFFTVENGSGSGFFSSFFCARLVKKTINRRIQMSSPRQTYTHKISLCCIQICVSVSLWSNLLRK